MKFPLSIGANGYESFDDEETTEAIRQNFKMLLLTSPGEYVMDPNFGVGLYNFLFELNTSLNRDGLSSAIVTQAAKYMPYVAIRSIDLNTSQIDNNKFSIRIVYRISKSVVDEIFDLTVTI
jgi:phage baseplate assembly protein W